MNAAKLKALALMDRRRNLLIACGALAVVAAAWMGAYIGASRSRYKVIGKVDPITGYTIEYTVSARYRKTVDKDTMAQARQELEAWAFDPAPPTPSSKWMNTHILGRSQPASDSRASGHSIRQATIRGLSPRGTMVDDEGYVELTAIPEIGTTVFKQHLLVSGCPATWCGIDVPVGTYKGSKMIQHFFSLFVRPKDHPIIYGFVGMAGINADAADVQNEMKAIRDSIRIQKTR